MSSRSRRSRRNSGGERTGQSQRDQAAAEVPIISGIYFLQMGGSEAREREIRNTTRNKERDGGREGETVNATKTDTNNFRCRFQHSGFIRQVSLQCRVNPRHSVNCGH